MGDPRKTYAWQQVCKQVLRPGSICAICFDPIDFNAKPRTRWSGSVDHIVPIVHGGSPLDLSNVRAAHYGCNSSRGARTPTQRINSRVW
jgi:5-methylcytosine-specific restriction endonuclease McrA